MNRMTFLVGLTLTGTLAGTLTSSGCFNIYEDIDRLQKNVPVHESEIPDGITSEQYAVGFGFGGVTGTGTDFLALGRAPDGVALLSFEVDGSLSTDAQPLANDVSFDARVPVAGLPELSSIVVGMRKDDGTGVLGLYSPGGLEATVLVRPVAAPPTGLALGATVFGDGTLADAVSVGGDKLSVTKDYLGAAALEECDVVGGKAVAVGDFIPGAAGLEVILVNATSFGVVTALNDGGGGTACQVPGTITELDATGGDGFAESITVGDFDADGIADIAVGHHSADRVYVVLDPAGVATVETIQGPENTRFGTALAAGDIDGDAGDELIIGASAGTGRGVANAGVASIYKRSTAFEEVAVLANGVAEAGEQFGRAVGVVNFDNAGKSRNIVVVGGPRRVYVNFRDPLNTADPRGE